MKTIYVIFTSTDLMAGRVIRAVTRNQYNHCSICLHEDLSKFYSFARVYRRHWLLGGFVVESSCRYLLSTRTLAKVVAINVDDQSFEQVRQTIAQMREHSEDYVYNYFSAAVYPLGRRFVRDNAFTCVEFTYKVLRLAGVDVPGKPNIERLEHELSGYPTWEGRAVDGFFDRGWGDDPYLEDISRRETAVQIARRFMRLVRGHA